MNPEVCPGAIPAGFLLVHREPGPRVAPIDARNRRASRGWYRKVGHLFTAPVASQEPSIVDSCRAAYDSR